MPNVIVFFGNRRGMALEDGIANSVTCLKEIARIAEPGKENATGKPDPNAQIISTMSRTRKTSSIRVGYFPQ